MSESRPTLAVFDFDGTLTTVDSSVPFIEFVRGRARVRRSLALGAPGFAMDLVAALVGELRAGPDRVSVHARFGQHAHERLLLGHFGGIDPTALADAGRRFAADDALRSIVAPGALEQVAWHRERGHACVLVTASIEAYTVPWGKAEGFAAVIASRLARDGSFAGGPCWGAAKVPRLIHAVGPLQDHRVVVYGNHPDDRALLAVADLPVTVRAGGDWHAIGERVRAALGS